MSRRPYIISFVILAFTFVPVWFSLVSAPVSFVGPCGYVAFVTLSNFLKMASQGHWQVLGLTAINLLDVALYTGVFYICARLMFHVSEEFEKVAGKISFQLLFLLMVFSCSFLKVIHGSSFVNLTGTYDFWTGCARFWESH